MSFNKNSDEGKKKNFNKKEEKKREMQSSGIHLLHQKFHITRPSSESTCTKVGEVLFYDGAVQAQAHVRIS